MSDSPPYPNHSPEDQLLFLLQANITGPGWSERARDLHAKITGRWQLVPVETKPDHTRPNTIHPVMYGADGVPQPTTPVMRAHWEPPMPLTVVERPHPTLREDAESDEQFDDITEFRRVLNEVRASPAVMPYVPDGAEPLTTQAGTQWVTPAELSQREPE